MADRTDSNSMDLVKRFLNESRLREYIWHVDPDSRATGSVSTNNYQWPVPESINSVVAWFIGRGVFPQDAGSTETSMFIHIDGFMGKYQGAPADTGVHGATAEIHMPNNPTYYVRATELDPIGIVGVPFTPASAFLRFRFLDRAGVAYALGVNHHFDLHIFVLKESVTWDEWREAFEGRYAESETVWPMKRAAPDWSGDPGFEGPHRLRRTTTVPQRVHVHMPNPDAKQ